MTNDIGERVERQQRIEKLMNTPLGTDVEVFTVVEGDPLKLGSAKLESGDWAHPLVVPAVRHPKIGDKLVVILNAVENKYFWISFVGENGFNW